MPSPYLISPLDAATARVMLAWRYEPPYDVYNIVIEPGAEQFEIATLLDPAYAYHQIHAENGALVGICCFGIDAQVDGGDYQQPALDLGLGMRPDLTGRGLGAGVVAAVIAFALARYTPPRLRVTIAAFNTRARRVWAGAGFCERARFTASWNQRDYVVMVRESATV